MQLKIRSLLRMVLYRMMLRVTHMQLPSYKQKTAFRLFSRIK